MLDFILAFFDKGLFKKKNVWVVGYVEDQRTMLVGNGYTEDGAMKQAHGDSRRLVQYSKDGLLKVYFPPNVNDPAEVPEDILKLINDHLGLPPIKNPQTEN